LLLSRLRPDAMQRNGRTWIYQATTGPKVFKEEEVLLLNLIDPSDDEGGISPMTAAMTPIDQGNLARMWNRNLLQRDARPSGILRFAPGQGSSPNERDAAAQEFMEKFGGST